MLLIKGETFGISWWRGCAKEWFNPDKGIIILLDHGCTNVWMTAVPCVTRISFGRCKLVDPMPTRFHCTVERKHVTRCIHRYVSVYELMTLRKMKSEVISSSTRTMCRQKRLGIVANLGRLRTQQTGPDCWDSVHERRELHCWLVHVGNDN